MVNSYGAIAGAISLVNEEETQLLQPEEGKDVQSNTAGPDHSKRTITLASLVAFVAAVGITCFAGGIAQNAQSSSFNSGDGPLLPLLSSSQHDHHKKDKHKKHDPKHGHKKHDPNEPLWFHQKVDHFAEAASSSDSSSDDSDDDNKYWEQRYYIDPHHFTKPGSPIFLVIGGEGTLESMLYPFINDHLAVQFGAFVVQPEHRFYGESQPLGSTLENLPSSEELERLLTPQQAMEDMLAIAQHYRYQVLGCSPHKSSKKYCPIITVGGSYPGFLSAMMRLVHPEIVDIGYASSAPLLLYSQEADQFGYYEVVTRSAERSSEGCAMAVKQTLTEVVDMIMQSESFADVAADVGICVDTIPEYITSGELFAQEAMMIVEDTFADANMDNYPPTDETDMAQMCKIFQDDALSSAGKVAAFYKRLMVSEDYLEDVQEISVDHHHKKNKNGMKCFDMRAPLPPGPNSTVSCSDWSGCGPGLDSYAWEFQECSLLTVQTGFSEKSMFPYRPFTLEWLNDHCQSKFGVTPQPYALVEEWGYDDLVGRGASYILFTNGLNDMWSAGSYLNDVSDTIVALNFPNGAHHSDLSHPGPTENDTDDLKQGFVQIANVLSEWLDEI